MNRQLGKPTFFITLSSNETGWPKLIQTLYKLKNNIDLTLEQAQNLHYIEKAKLVNEDAVTCAIYFNKLVNTVLNTLQLKNFSPFGQHRVSHYFKRIEYQNRGSAHAHILVWSENDISNPLGDGMDAAIKLIDSLISVSASDASGNIRYQTHKHTFTCYKKIVSNQKQECRLIIITPLDKHDKIYTQALEHYRVIKENLETKDYQNFDEFYDDNNINSDEQYIDILRAGISRPRVFIRRQPSEKWINPFCPFIFNEISANMDIQFILDEYSVANYVSDYVNKTNRGISDLNRHIVKIMNEHPEFNINETCKRVGIDMLNGIEMSSQEAAWYLLRQPMSKSSVEITYIPTVWPQERERMIKSEKQLQELDHESTDIFKENWFDKYEKRSNDLDDITLAQFVARYTVDKNNGNYHKRRENRVIRYRNYKMTDDLNEYKREMVTLHVPFRDEINDILQDSKYIEIFDENQEMIMNNIKEFVSNLDFDKIMQECHEINNKDEYLVDNEIVKESTNNDVIDEFEKLFNSRSNEEINSSVIDYLGPIAKKKENIMNHQEFCKLMQMTTEGQRNLALHVIHKLTTPNLKPLQFVFSGAAGCGKSFEIIILKELYNRRSPTDGFFNAYITSASTGKAAVAIDGMTIHSTLKITRLRTQLPLSAEALAHYRVLFKYVKVLIIDEISMISAEFLEKIDSRLKQITGNYKDNF